VAALVKEADMTGVLAEAAALPQERRLVTEIPGPRSRELMTRRAAALSYPGGATLPVFVEPAGGGVVVLLVPKKQI
jgi:4-aminobutyrate aminotransferase/(S)-3-amino-2-methylpropionate transaminase